MSRLVFRLMSNKCQVRELQEAKVKLFLCRFTNLRKFVYKIRCKKATKNILLIRFANWRNQPILLYTQILQKLGISEHGYDGFNKWDIDLHLAEYIHYLPILSLLLRLGETTWKRRWCNMCKTETLGYSVEDEFSLGLVFTSCSLSKFESITGFGTDPRFEVWSKSPIIYCSWLASSFFPLLSITALIFSLRLTKD